MMLSMGLHVDGGELLASARQARRVVHGLLANFVLVPVVTVGLLHVFHADADGLGGVPHPRRRVPARRSDRRSPPSPRAMSPGPSGRW